jgi:hypothetical protein
MPYRFNPFTMSLDYYAAGTGGAGAADGKEIILDIFESIPSGLTGTLTPTQTSGDFVFDDFGRDGADAVVSEEGSHGRPNNIEALDANGDPVDVTLNGLGEWEFSSAPLVYPVDIVYRWKVVLADFDDSDPNIIGSYMPQRKLPVPGQITITVDATDIANGYFEVGEKAVDYSLQLFSDGIKQSQTSATATYSESVVGGVTRITFLGALAAGGDYAAQAGDQFDLTFMYYL